VSAFRFAGCRHPLGAEHLPARDGQWLRCQPCGELRQVREVESVRDLVPRPGATPQPTEPGRLDPEDITRRVANAAGKGQVALLVVDAAGVVVVGLKATGGLTELRHVPQDGLWRFSGALSGKPEVLDGSYALRNQLGTEHTPERWEAEQPGPLLVCPSCSAPSWEPQDAREGICRACGWRRPAVQVPLPELEADQPTLPYPGAWRGELPESEEPGWGPV
jgi:hypothetical protein